MRHTLYEVRLFLHNSSVFFLFMSLIVSGNN